MAVDEARAAFPKIPGMRFPGSPNPLEQLDYGPEFNRLGGVITNHPPLASARYPVLVPKADGDGFDVAGIHLVQVRAPLGTTTGWNVRTATTRAGDLCGLSGSYVPLRRRRPSGPRPAIRAGRSKSGIVPMRASSRRWRRPRVSS